MGFNPSGDIGPFTFYTSKRRRPVRYIKAPPLTPPTFRQRIQRHRFRTAGFLWRLLPQESKDAWLDAARLSKIRIHGYNLYTWWLQNREDDAINTIIRLSGIQLPPIQEP